MPIMLPTMLIIKTTLIPTVINKIVFIKITRLGKKTRVCKEEGRYRQYCTNIPRLVVWHVAL